MTCSNCSPPMEMLKSKFNNIKKKKKSNLQKLRMNQLVIQEENQIVTHYSLFSQIKIFAFALLSIYIVFVCVVFLSLGVNQWMQRTVSLSLMYSRSNFVWSIMPGD